MEDELIREGQFGAKSGYEQAQCLFSLHSRPTAVYAFNAAMNVAALRAIFDCGLRCPQEVALVSFDDPDWFDAIRPRVSAMAQLSYDLGSTAAQMLLERISGQITTPSAGQFWKGR